MSTLRISGLIFFLIFISLVTIHGNNQDADTLENEIEIWPGVGPGSDSLNIEEKIIVRSLTGTCTRDWAVEKITVPTITPLFPDTPNGAAVLICPGGAYARVVYDVEGMDIGRWLNSIGITAFVLKYRLPKDDHKNKKYVPLQDAQRAMRFIRANATKWNLDTNKIGISGASAGGHMASCLSTMYNKVVYDPRDSIDSLNARPDFMFLIYPVVSMESSITHTGSRDLLLGVSPSQELIDEFSPEKNVTSNSPVTFLAHAKDDGVIPENSNRLYLALIDSGLEAEFHLFNNGGHGVGICKAGSSEFAKWPAYCTNWLNKIGMTKDTVEIKVEPEDTSSNPNAIYLKHKNVNEPFYIYPNPVTRETNLFFNVEKSGRIIISIVDISGREAIQLLDFNKQPGNYHIAINPDLFLKKGIYLLKYNNCNSAWTKKIIVD